MDFDEIYIYIYMDCVIARGSSSSEENVIYISYIHMADSIRESENEKVRVVERLNHWPPGIRESENNQVENQALSIPPPCRQNRYITKHFS
jgi:hypothetical protein